MLIVQDQRYQLYYSHWAANTLTRDLFWGPDHAVRFISMQRQVDESDWLDEVWAEGGAVVDLDRQNLLLFGGEDLQHDVPLRRVYIELLSRVWKPWTVHWAFEGIADLADHVNYPRIRVLYSREEETASSLAPPEDAGWVDTIASIRWTADRTRYYPLCGDVEAYLFGGPDLLSAPGPESGLNQFVMGEPSDTFPSGGFHIDVPACTCTFRDFIPSTRHRQVHL